ncbi:MAG: hypothetical protein ABIG03_07315 [Candidatus Eisenbacteria bacterium]
MKRVVMLSVMVVIVVGVVFVLSRDGTVSGLVPSGGVASASAADGTGPPDVAGSEDSGTGMAAIERARESGRYLFIFFHGGGDARMTAEMRNVFDNAVEELDGRVDHIAINVKSAAERDIVDKLKVDRAPMPLAVAIAPNGAITGGFPGRFTKEQLAGSIVSAATEKCLAALQDGDIVLVCVQGASTTKNDAAMTGVRALEADTRYADTSSVVMVDPGDSRERELLDRLGVDVGTAEAITIMMVPPATAVAQFSGETDETMLVKALEAAASAAACAPGAGSGCCPGK